MLFKNRKYKHLILKAKYSFTQAELEESASYYREAFKIKVVIPDYLMYGFILIDLEQFVEAEKVFLNLNEDFDFTEVNYGLACIYDRTNRKKQALERYEKVIINNPDFEPAYFSTAYIYDDLSEENNDSFESENVTKAIKYYKKSIELNDDINNFWSYLNLGSIYERFNKDEEALEYFLKAHNIYPNKEMINYNIGVAYYKLKQYDQSLHYYLEELKQPKPFKSTYYNLGILYKDGFKDYQLAKIYYLKGLELNNEDFNIWYNLGCIHALLKDYDNAFSCFKYIYYKNKKYLKYIADDKELEEFRKTEYYSILKKGL